MAEHIVAIFDTAAAADAAARDLEGAGIPASAIRRYQPPAGEIASDASAHNTDPSTSGGGFWAWLLGEEPSTDTAHSYYPRDEDRFVQGARAGNAIVSVVLENDSQIHRVVTILETHHPIEMEEETDESTANLVAGATAPVSTSLASGQAASTHAGTEEVLPLAEEKIEVGKRTVDRGVTRVRRYVVERPVEQEITLRGERVTIERRRPLETTAAPGRTFEERVVEVHETEEVPVVEKTARVVEEVAIRKEQTERTETVRDTVRREEVDVTDAQGRPVPRT